MVESTVLTLPLSSRLRLNFTKWLSCNPVGTDIRASGSSERCTPSCCFNTDHSPSEDQEEAVTGPEVNKPLMALDGNFLTVHNPQW